MKRLSKHFDQKQNNFIKFFMLYFSSTTKRMKRMTFFTLFLIAFLTSCDNYNNVVHQPSVVGTIDDNDSWFASEKIEALEMRVYIPTPNEYLCAPYDDLNAPPRPCTLEDVDHDLIPNDDYEPTLHVYVEMPDFNSSDHKPNAVLKIKGDYSRTSAQKSYSIKLDSKTNLYNGERKFGLTKSSSDKSRLKNKVAMELLKDVPDILGLKVQYWHLFINDVDYGLFNQPESIRKEFLVRRGWNPEDKLYNANEFFFEKTHELTLDEKGEPLYPDLFNQILEIKNGHNHTKLLEMIDAINSSEDIDDVIKHYFNRENFITWLAFDLVVNDKDTIQHNYYLYNPEYSDVFYFLPWDYDGAWSTTQYLSRADYGISVWWRSMLQKRFFQKRKNREDVYNRAYELRQKYVTPQRIESIVDKYKDIVLPFQLVLPDSEHNSLEAWQESTAMLSDDIDQHIKLFESVMGSPMPFHQYIDYNSTSHQLNISWEESIDFENDPIVYDVTLYDNNLSTKIFEEDNLTTLSYQKNIVLTSGTYYLQVISKEKENPQHFQVSYGSVELNDKFYFGYKPLVIEDVK